MEQQLLVELLAMVTSTFNIHNKKEVIISNHLFFLFHFILLINYNSLIQIKKGSLNMTSVVTSTGLAHYHEKVKELLNNKADYRPTRSFQENTGKLVYVKLFTLTITSNYADINYEFAVTGRGTVHLMSIYM